MSILYIANFRDCHFFALEKMPNRRRTRVWHLCTFISRMGFCLYFCYRDKFGLILRIHLFPVFAPRISNRAGKKISQHSP